jgi:aryl-alcohol dehydrogenase (NADP+)
MEEIGVVPYNPLAAGFLAGKYKRGEEPGKDTRFTKIESVRPLYWNDANFDLVEKLSEVATAHGKTPAQLALAWLVSNPVVTAPILGTSKVSQLEENLKAADMTLSKEEEETLNGLHGESHETQWHAERGSLWHR